MKKQIAAAILSLFLFPSPALPTAGFAEWDIPTPFGNQINHTDPFTGEYGTSIRPQGYSESDIPYVTKVESWTFYVNYVAGKAEKGCFLFNETTKEAEYFAGEAAQAEKMKALGLLNPISPEYTGSEGWLETYVRGMGGLDLIKKRRTELSQSEDFTQMSEEQKKQMRKFMEKEFKIYEDFALRQQQFYSKLRRKIERFPEFQKLETSKKQMLIRYIAAQLGEK